jgi:hypothetical protein
VGYWKSASLKLMIPPHPVAADVDVTLAWAKFHDSSWA